MSENQMIVSNLGLLNICKKVADLRKYESELISKVGEINIVNGSAQNFDDENYLYKSDMSFTGTEITIETSGYYYPSEGEQVVWFLESDYRDYNIVFQFDSNQASIIIDSRVALKISHLGLKDNTNFKSIVKLSKNKCTLTLNIFGVVYEKTVDLEITAKLSRMHTLYIGHDPLTPGDYWQGGININDFVIYEDNKLFYTPSTSYSFTLSRILIGDETFPLDNGSIPVADHVFEINFEEITRANNTILATAKVNENIKLTIKEVGLYVRLDSGEEILFSVIRNLNINKSKNIPYDLMFTINLSLEFVNVVGFPDENSFDLEIFEPALFKNFEDIREIMFYIISSMERLVYENAQRIGYNKAQEYYRLQQKIENEEDCYSNVQSYTKLFKKLRITEKAVFTLDNIVQIFGNLEISDNGTTSGFSDTDYIYTNIVAPNDKEWETNLSFKLENNLTPSLDRVIATFIGGEYDSEGSVHSNGLKSIVVGIQNHRVYLKIWKQNSNELLVDNHNLFEINSKNQYFLKIQHTIKDEKHIIKVKKTIENKPYETVLSLVTDDTMNNTYILFLGGEATYDSNTEKYNITNPFLQGDVYLVDCNAICGDDTWINTKDVILNGTKLLQYYRIPELNESSFKTRDLNNKNYFISILENELKGNEDLINIANSGGFSLCFKVFLKDINSKLLLAKTNLIETPYFTFSYFNKILDFTVYGTEIYSVQKQIEDKELESYQQAPILVSIVFSKNDSTIKMYKNNELISEIGGIVNNTFDPSSYFLTNFIQDSVLENICNKPEILNGSNIEDFVQEVKNNQEKYIQNILVIEGELKESDLYYINNLMDTNF